MITTSLKYGLVAIAVHLAIAHSLFPHEHGTKNPEQGIISSDRTLSLLETLLQSLATNIGEDHLEDWLIEKKSVPPVDHLSCALKAEWTSDQPVRKNVIGSHVVVSSLHRHPPPHSDRGPPLG